MKLNLKVTKKKKKERLFSFNFNLASLCTNIKLHLNNFIVIFSQFLFCIHCRVPFLFVVNVSTCIVNRMGYWRKKENVLLEE